MSINCIRRDQAVIFLNDHDGVARVENTKHEIIAWCECVGPGGEYVEKQEFMPDIYDLFDLNALRDWLGY